MNAGKAEGRRDGGGMSKELKTKQLGMNRSVFHGI